MSRREPMSGLARLVIAIVVGAIVGVLVGLANPALGVLSGISAMGLAFVVAGLITLWPMSAEQTRRDARREGFNPFVEELVIVLVAVCSLIGIVVLLVLGDSGIRHSAAAIGLAGVFLAWAMLHLMYAARYAVLYYSKPVGGLDFGDNDAPSYQDFIYVAFAVGMTFGVTDTGVTSTPVRSVVLRHGLLSYLFGSVILAATINLVSGIVTS